MMMPYVWFGGNCEEAFTFYATVFGGEIEGTSRWADGPMAGKVMHSQVKLGRMGTLSGADEQGAAPPAGFMLLVHCKDGAEGRALMAALAEGGGTILFEMTPHPPPDDGGMGGMVQDRYGIKWCMTAPNDL